MKKTRNLYSLVNAGVFRLLALSFEPLLKTIFSRELSFVPDLPPSQKKATELIYFLRAVSQEVGKLQALALFNCIPVLRSRILLGSFL